MIYLDNSATTKPHEDVLKAFVATNELYYANPASIHEKGVEANALLSRAREQIASVLQTADNHIVFTSGGTESNNFAIFGIAESHCHIGKHIITTVIEHPAVLEPIKKLQAQGYEVDYLGVNANGQISLSELQALIRKDTVLVSIMHVNNEMGAIQPIYEAAEIIHANSRAFFHVDAVQSFGKLPVHFADEAGPDAITISGHKIYALKGSGILAFRKRPIITPQQLGGGQEFGLRSGTVAVAQNVVLAKAVRLAELQRENNTKKLSHWRDMLHATLATLPGVKLLSSVQGAPHIVSFSVAGMRGEILINALQSHNIIVSTSSACSSKQQQTSHVIDALHVPDEYRRGVVRMSLGIYNTEEEIKTVQAVLQKVVQQLKGDLNA